jgi:RNA polymerase sigma factor (sigma-70 family)
MRASEFIKEATNPLATRLKNIATRTQAANYDPEYQYYNGKRQLEEPIPMELPKPIEIPDTSSIEQVEHNIEIKQLKKILDRYMDSLSTREQQVIKMRFYMGLTLEQIAERLGTTSENIRQFEAKALYNLRKKAKIDNELSHYYEKGSYITSAQSSPAYRTGYQDGANGNQFNPDLGYTSNDKEYYRLGYVAGYEQYDKF